MQSKGISQGKNTINAAMELDLNLGGLRDSGDFQREKGTFNGGRLQRGAIIVHKNKADRLCQKKKKYERNRKMQGRESTIEEGRSSLYFPDVILSRSVCRKVGKCKVGGKRKGAQLVTVLVCF